MTDGQWKTAAAAAGFYMIAPNVMTVLFVLMIIWVSASKRKRRR